MKRTHILLIVLILFACDLYSQAPARKITLPTQWSECADIGGLPPPATIKKDDLQKCIDESGNLWTAVTRIAQDIPGSARDLFGNLSRQAVDFLNSTAHSFQGFLGADLQPFASQLGVTLMYWVGEPLQDLLSPESTCDRRILGAVQVVSLVLPPVKGTKVLTRLEGKMTVTAFEDVSGRVVKVHIRGAEQAAVLAEEKSLIQNAYEGLTRQSDAFKIRTMVRETFMQSRMRTIWTTRYALIEVWDSKGRIDVARNLATRFAEFKTVKGFAREAAESEILSYIKQESQCLRMGKGTIDGEDCLFTEVTLRDGSSVILMYDPDGDGFIFVQPSQSSASRNQGLVAYYLFNGNANDESGNGNNGERFGTTSSYDRFNSQDKAYEFNGRSDYIIVKESPSLEFGTGDFAVCAWIRTTSQSGMRVVSKGECFSVGWVLGLLRGRINIQMQFRGPVYFASNRNNYADGNWHLIIFNRRNGNVYIYGDGVADGGPFPFSSSLTNVNEILTIGRTRQSGGACDDAFFSGGIDDVRIYNRALSEDEIQQIYREGGWNK